MKNFWLKKQPESLKNRLAYSLYAIYGEQEEKVVKWWKEYFEELLSALGNEGMNERRK